jgi:hypothetical protein
MGDVSRAFDSPLSTRDAADYMGFTPEWIRIAINEGVFAGGARVKLEAESVQVNGRRVLRIHVDKFREFLQGIGWKRLPAGFQNN